jgi:hypothetical protein
MARSPEPPADLAAPGHRYSRCPRCQHHSLPADQSLPAACPACGLILAKFGQAPRRTRPVGDEAGFEDSEGGWVSRLTEVPPRDVGPAFWLRVLMLAGLSLWSWSLIGMDYRHGDIGGSFIHRPILVFHEAGHVLFRLLGEWMMVLGGTLGQLLMPAILAGALLMKNRDTFGAAVGLWFFGVSVLDIAPYMYDALQPRLMLLSGRTGEDGGHDWIYLFSSLGLLPKAQLIGAVCHKLGALIMLLALGWGGWLLLRQYRRP